MSEAASVIPSLLEDIQNRLYDKYVTMVLITDYSRIVRAKKDLDDHLVYTYDWKVFCQSLDQKKVE